MKYRKIRDGLNESEEGWNFIKKTPFVILFLEINCFKARIQMMMGDLNEANDTLQFARQYISEVKTPWFLIHFLLSQFILDLNRFEESIKIGNESELTVNRRKALKSGKNAVKNSRRVRTDSTEIFKLMGVYYWYTGNQKKALNWWEKSIREGEMSGSRLELSRTYMEVGKRLLEEKSKYEELNGVSADEYLEKAEALFKKMDLQWDLEELAKVKKNIHKI